MADEHPVSVLVVDDDYLIRQYLTMGLRYKGYEVLEARDGGEALRMDASWRPDIVVLDLGTACWS